MMRELFERQERPLYGQAVPMRLERLADADIAAYVGARFRESGRSAGEAVNPLLASAKGHPQRAMLLAYRLWEQVDTHAPGTLRDWMRAHEAALAELQPEFDAHWRRLSVSEQRAVRAVVAGDGAPFQQRVLDQLGLKKSTAQGSLKSLVEGATVELREGGYALVDPLFAEWIGNLRLAGEESVEP